MNGNGVRVDKISKCWAQIRIKQVKYLIIEVVISNSHHYCLIMIIVMSSFTSMFKPDSLLETSLTFSAGLKKSAFLFIVSQIGRRTQECS